MIAFVDSTTAGQAELHAMTTDELRAEFRDGLRLTTVYLTRLALVLNELESRGEKVIGVDAGLLSLLRRIGTGELLAEVVVRFASTPQAMRQVGRLPVEEQRRIVEDEEECERLTMPKKYSNRVSRGMLPREDGKGIESRQPIVAARLSTPKDLAALIVDMIQANPKPDAVWAEVCRLRDTGAVED